MNENENTATAAVDTFGAAGTAAAEAQAQENAPAQAQAHEAAAETAAQENLTGEGTGTEAEAAKAKEEAEAEATPPDPSAELAKKLEAAEQRLLGSMAEAAALKLGVRPERMKHALRLADLSGIDSAAEDAAAKIDAAVKAVLDELPELAGGAQGTGSPGAFQRQREPQKSPFEKGLEG
jgi:hypothetical protein